MELDLFDTTFTLDMAYLEADPSTVLTQLREYERGERQSFDIAIDADGTFLKQVMQAIRAIPYGSTATYGELAQELDTAPIAVGQACARNPVPIIVPCHRVLASDGSLRGYSGPGGLETKQTLLEFEGVSISTLE